MINPNGPTDEQLDEWQEILDDQRRLVKAANPFDECPRCNAPLSYNITNGEPEVYCTEGCNLSPIHFENTEHRQP